MNGTVLRSVARETFIQAWRSAGGRLFLAFSLLGFLACLIVPLSVPNFTSDTLGRFQFYFAGVGGGTIGLVVLLAITSGAIPSFVDPNHAMIVLAKPVRRWWMLLGRMVGVIAFVGTGLALFALATWLPMSATTGQFRGQYLLVFLILYGQYVAFFGFMAMLGVATRSASASLFGTLLFWLMCWMMNVGRHALAGSDLSEFSGVAHVVGEMGYWMLPKPADVEIVAHQLLYPVPLEQRVPEMAALAQRPMLPTIAALVSSLAAPVMLAGVACYEFETAEY